MFWGQIKPHQATSSHITLHSLVQNPSDSEISGAGEESILEEEEMVKVVALGKLYKMMTGFTGKHWICTNWIFELWNWFTYMEKTVHIWGDVNEGKKCYPIIQQKCVWLDGMKSVILLK